MNKNKVHILSLCIILILTLLVGCGGTKIQLSEDQEASINMIIKWREEWKEYKDFVDCVPANRLHIAEVSTKDGKVFTFMTVAYFKGNTFVARGYVAGPEYFQYVDMAHQDWLSDCVTVDLENMSDDELREVLRDLYIAYLEKKAE